MTAPFIQPTVESGRWEPPTMKSVQEIEGNPLVLCGCGRSVSADMMRVLGDGFACDACHERMFREGTLTRLAFAESHDAPASVIAKAQQQDADQQASAGRSASPTSATSIG
jgi:hypothetical protein